MNVVDSSAWISYFNFEKNAELFDGVISEPELLLVPSICILEVFRFLLRSRGEQNAYQAAGFMSQGHIVNLDEALALEAARFGMRWKLSLADSIIYATAQLNDAILWTQDKHFAGLPGVEYRVLT